MASGMFPKALCSSSGFQAMLQQWPFEFIWIPDQCLPRCVSAQTRFLPWFLTSFCGTGFNGQFWTDLRRRWPLRFPIGVQLSLLRTQVSSLVSHVTLRGFNNQLWTDLRCSWPLLFPIGVQFCLFSDLRRLSLCSQTLSFVLLTAALTYLEVRFLVVTHYRAD